MKKNPILFSPVILSAVATAALAIICAAVWWNLGTLISAVIIVLGSCFIIVKTAHMNKNINSLFNRMNSSLIPQQQDKLAAFPLPIVLTDSAGIITWYNSRFRNTAIKDEDIFGHAITTVFANIDLENPCPEQGFQVDCNGHMFSAFTTRMDQDYLIYLVDDNKLKHIAKEYFYSRPAVVTVLVDNYTELAEIARDNERSQFIGELEYLIENFARENNAFFHKMEKDRFLLIMEDRYLRPILEKRFPLLDAARKIVIGNMPVTLSIGVGREAPSVMAAGDMSVQALDMALGRGGDQAAVKTKNGYDFYGGVSKGVEKRTKVRTRIIATALDELIQSSSNILLMGHGYADLDSLGSSIGMYAAITHMSKPVRIVLDINRSLAKPLYDRMIQNGYADAFVEPSEALNLVDTHTLLIVLDTHAPYFVESPELYNCCANVVVIDHHRKMVEHIDRAVIFYHEPHASSASEMVAELVQYLSTNGRINSLEGEALLAGMMLDTKNFVLRTGVRTFEAAAYLRRLGADTVSVRKLFSSSMESYQEKSRLVASAKLYNRCAIASANYHCDDIKVVAAQAADELLGISGVDASFVIFEDIEGVASISGRSMGIINVQLILERLGGGGHHTMAGTQIKGVDMEQAHCMLLEAIDHYHEEQTKND